MSHKHDHDHDHNHEDGKPCYAELNGLECSMEHYTVTESIVREDIIAKAKELAELITTSTEVEFYKKAEKQINTNEHVQSLINAIKKKQKEAVAFEQTFKNPEMVKKIDQEIESLQDELDSIPVVAEFQQTQSDLNYMLQLVMNVVRDTVSEKIQVEEGTVEVTRCD
jgi:cell fate (sporulation/competence/biofilm development) regulator YmcA (YheA/YmcA/DUF963 family)